MEQVPFSWIAFNFLRVAKPLQGDSLLLISNSPGVLNRTSAVSFSRIALVNHSASVYLYVYTSASLKHATLAKQAYTPPSKVAYVFVGRREGRRGRLQVKLFSQIEGGDFVKKLEIVSLPPHYNQVGEEIRIELEQSSLFQTSLAFLQLTIILVLTFTLSTFESGAPLIAVFF